MDATISIKSQISNGEESDGIEVLTDGEYSFGSGVIRLSYDETDLTGMQGTRTIFDVYSDYATMSRVGSVNSYVRFKSGEAHHFAYNTPEGVLTMSIETSSLVSRLGVAGGTLELHYSIGMQGSPISRNDILIQVEPRQ